LDWLGRRRSAWVIDDPQMSGAWQATIARLLGVANTDVMVIDLGKVKQPAGVAA